MIRPPPRSTLSSSSAASDVYKRQAKIWATTAAASATTLAVSHLFDVTGPGWSWARSVSSTGRMSALVRGAAVASNTVPTSAIRFRFRFSPLDSRVVSCLLLYTSDAADEEDSVDLG